jgi:serine/threonine protein kinase
MGEGTFGKVYRCLNTKTNTQHAIKVIKKNYDYIYQGLVEIKMLDKFVSNPEIFDFEKQHLVKMQDFFVYKE